MKKTILTTLLVLALLLIHSQVYADMGAPMLNAYEASVSNPNGATYYQFDYTNDTSSLISKGTLSYGTTVEINYEEKFNGKTYGMFSQNSIWGYIDLDDLKLLNDVSGKSIEPIYSEEITITVLEEDGLEIHEGPAYAYNVVGEKIPYKTKLIAYRIGEYANSEDPWFYVNYKDTAGYVCELNGTLGTPPSYAKTIKTPTEINIYSSTAQEEVIGTLAPNTIIKSFYDVDAWSRMYYVRGKVSGYVSMYDVTIAPINLYKQTLHIPTEGYDLYEYADESSKIITHVTEGDYSFKYCTDAIYYDEPGWVNISYNNQNGWVLTDSSHLNFNFDQLVEDDEEEIETIEPEDENIENAIEEIDSTVMPVEDSQKIELEPGIRFPQIIVICVIVGIIVAITTTITITYINRKSKEEEKTDEHSSNE